MEDIINFLKDQEIDIDPFNDNYEAVDLTTDIEEIEGSWVFPPIFKEDSHGNTVKWQIGFSHVTKKLITVVGRIETGGMQIFPVDIIPSKLNRDYRSKAFQEAKTKFENKIREGYKYDTGFTTVDIPQPMLANKYKPPTDTSAGNILHFPVAAQAKFDGIRNIIYIDGDGNCIMLTRKMNKRLHFNKIRDEAFKLLTFLPRGTILDGEIFSDKVPFQTITSIGASEIIQHPEEDLLDYYLFDIYHPETVWKRGMTIPPKSIVDEGIYMKASGFSVEDYTEAREYLELRDSLESEVHLCQNVNDLIENVQYWTLQVRLRLMINSFSCFWQKYGHYPIKTKLTKTYILGDHEAVYKIFKEFKDKGLEGAMIRHFAQGGTGDPLKSLYRPGRSDNLIKVKDTMETEVIITGVTSGRGRAKELAIFLYKEPDTGLTGTVTPSMTHEQRRYYLKHPEEVIGKTYTVSFQNRTRDGKMRFPVGISFRGEE